MRIIGRAARPSHQAKSASVTTAAPSSAVISTPGPSREPALIPSSSSVSPEASSSAPAISNRSPALGGLAGKPRRNTRLINAIGARNQNTAGQPQRATNTPPISGPRRRAQRENQREHADRMAAPLFGVERR